jgi:hypothetical protein
MEKKFTANVSACVDCVMCIEYGASEHNAEFKSGMLSWGAKSAYNLTDEEEYFSWNPCDICGSTLGGNRYDAVLVND